MEAILCSTFRSQGSLRSPERVSTRPRSPPLSSSCTAKASSTGLNHTHTHTRSYIIHRKISQVYEKKLNKSLCLEVQNQCFLKNVIFFSFFNDFNNNKFNMQTYGAENRRSCLVSTNIRDRQMGVVHCAVISALMPDQRGKNTNHYPFPISNSLISYSIFLPCLSVDKGCKSSFLWSIHK